MADHSNIDREALILRVRQWVEHFKAEAVEATAECKVEMTVDGVKQSGDPWDLVRPDDLTLEELQYLDAMFPRIAAHTTFMKTPEFRRHLEHQCFGEYLKERQGTQLLDFDKLYRERERLQRKLDERQDEA